MRLERGKILDNSLSHIMHNLSLRLGTENTRQLLDPYYADLPLLLDTGKILDNYHIEKNTFLFLFPYYADLLLLLETGKILNL